MVENRQAGSWSERMDKCLKDDGHLGYCRQTKCALKPVDRRTETQIHPPNRSWQASYTFVSIKILQWTFPRFEAWASRTPIKRSEFGRKISFSSSQVQTDHAICNAPLNFKGKSFRFLKYRSASHQILHKDWKEWPPMFSEHWDHKIVRFYCAGILGQNAPRMLGCWPAELPNKCAWNVRW